MNPSSRASRHDEADAIPALLATTHQTLDDVLTVLFDHAGQAGHLIAPFMVAAGAAADGRDAAAAAPSLPANTGHQPGPQRLAPEGASPADIADALAEVTRVLTAQLASAVNTASDPRDRAALATARRCAETVHSCLEGTS